MHLPVPDEGPSKGACVSQKELGIF